MNFPFFLERNAEVKVLQISPNSSFVALGQPLKLNVTVTVNYVTDERYHIPDSVHIRWSFRRFSSTSFEELANALWRVDRNRVYTNSYDSRASIVDNATLVMVNTSLNDSGTYHCYIDSSYYFIGQRVYFNVAIEGRYSFDVNLLKII